MADNFIVIRITRRVAFLISSVLREMSSKLHWSASKAAGAKAEELRQEADDVHRVAKDIENAMHPGSRDDG